MQGLRITFAVTRRLVHATNTTATLTQVWNVLRNLRSYTDWHPYVAIEGDAGLDEVLRIELTAVPPGPGRLIIPARILLYSPPTQIGWRFGVPRLLWIDDRITLSPLNTGTHIEHEVVFSGPLAGLVSRFGARRAVAMLARVNEALGNHIAKTLSERSAARVLTGARRNRSRSGQGRRS